MLVFLIAIMDKSNLAVLISPIDWVKKIATAMVIQGYFYFSDVLGRAVGYSNGYAGW